MATVLCVLRPSFTGCSDDLNSHCSGSCLLIKSADAADVVICCWPCSNTTHKLLSSCCVLAAAQNCRSSGFHNAHSIFIHPKNLLPRRSWPCSTLLMIPHQVERLATWRSCPPARPDACLAARQAIIMTNATDSNAVIHRQPADHHLCMEDSADMVLLVDGQRVKAHSSVMAAYCGVLRNLVTACCSSPCSPAEPLTVDLSKAAGASAAAVQELVAHVYGHRDITTVGCLTDAFAVQSVYGKRNLCRAEWCSCHEEPRCMHVGAAVTDRRTKVAGTFEVGGGGACSWSRQRCCCPWRTT